MPRYIDAEELKHRLNNSKYYGTKAGNAFADMIAECESIVKEINYVDCSDALLKMWMDDVLTDGEYSRIMEKLNRWEKEKTDAEIH